VKNQDWKFWAVWIGLILIGLWIYSRVQKTAQDAGTAANNLYINPLKTLFGTN